MGSNKYLVRIIIEEVEQVNDTVTQYRGEVHGEDMMTYDDLSVAREAVESFSVVLADYVAACNSIASDPDASAWWNQHEAQHG